MDKKNVVIRVSRAFGGGTMSLQERVKKRDEILESLKLMGEDHFSVIQASNDSVQALVSCTDEVQQKIKGIDPGLIAEAEIKRHLNPPKPPGFK